MLSRLFLLIKVVSPSISPNCPLGITQKETKSFFPDKLQK